MDIEKLKILVINMEVLLDEIKKELNGNQEEYKNNYNPGDFSSPIHDYDEVFDE